MTNGPIVHSEGGGIGCVGCLATLWFIAYPVLFVLLPALGGATGGAGGAFAGALGSVALAGLFWPWLIGLFVLGLLALVTRPSSRVEVRLPAQQVPAARPVEPAPSTKACPMCAETVMAAARICRYCGHKFTEASGEPVGVPAAALAPPPILQGGGALRPAESAAPGQPAATPADWPGDSSPWSDAKVRGGLTAAVRWPRLSRRAWATGVSLVLVTAIVFFAATTVLASRQVPVVACATTYGAETPTPASLPLTVNEPLLSPSAAAQLAHYASADGSYVQLAPRGWICTASVGADGSWGLTIHPITDPSATIELDGAFNGPGVYMAAALFPEAHQACEQQFSGSATDPCPGQPPNEVVERKSSMFVLYSDPPNSPGSGDLASVYAVFGAMTYNNPPSGSTTIAPTVERVACALPPLQQDLCHTIVDASATSWQGQQ